MKWHKLGKIFSPTSDTLPSKCIGFSQSPQTLVFKTFVRVYFSTRELDANGKYLSHVAFVDFDKNFNKIINKSSETVIPLGETGCFDEHGIFPFNVLRNGSKIYAYTTGWNRRISVSTDASIGFAVSNDDGLTFEKISLGPILSASLNEPFLVGDAFVQKYDDTYHMWYIFGTRWVQSEIDRPAERVYKIAHATSFDGVEWIKEGRSIIKDKLNVEECQALPTVIKIKNKFHMYFCYRHAVDFRNNPARSYRIGYASSDDMVNWVRDDENAGIAVTENAWDSDMLCYPHVFEMDGDVYMMYNGNEFGRYGFGIAKLIM